MTEQRDPEPRDAAERDEDPHTYVDRSKIDFDPDDGLYTGTLVEGTSEIPGAGQQDDGADS